MAKKLTPITVANVKPRDKRIEIPDGGCAGLYLIIQPNGHRSWAVRYRFGGKPCKLTLGPADALSLADARARATAALKKVAGGTDPAVEKRHEKADDKAAGADTVENLAKQFVEHYCKVKGNRTWKRTEAYLNKEVLPRWKGRTVHEITQDDVEHLIDSIAEDRPIAANRVLAVVRKWFSWMGGRYKGGRKAVLKSRLKINPCLNIEPPGSEKKRARVLSTDEIRAAWAACNQIGDPFGSFVKLSLLTGQRRSEVAGMRRSEIGKSAWTDDKKTIHAADIWTLPEARTKNKLLHAVPLPAQAMAIVEKVTRIVGDFVFTTDGRSPISGFSRFKARLDRLAVAELRKIAEGRGDRALLTYVAKVEKIMAGLAAARGDARKRLARELNAVWWTLHDLRRTLSTGMAEIRVLPYVIDAVTNHVSGEAKKDVSGTYNRWSYFPEKADALQRWADHVEELVGGNVTSLPKGRRAA